jgi:hypothetical protein
VGLEGGLRVGERKSVEINMGNGGMRGRSGEMETWKLEKTIDERGK